MGKINWSPNEEYVLGVCYDLAEGSLAPIQYDLAIERCGIGKDEFMKFRNYLIEEELLKGVDFLSFRLTSSGINKSKRLRGL
ncbi:hypothetical protein C8255_05415 [filamentous cyanobacterium CCP3]|nr:hypothetical protein C8255_05415 [filamentous cyanobacterium CCP3]